MNGHHLLGEILCVQRPPRHGGDVCMCHLDMIKLIIEVMKRQKPHPLECLSFFYIYDLAPLIVPLLKGFMVHERVNSYTKLRI